jgi:hypothetical protein
MDEESWPLSAALAWIACRRPLRFDQWDDAVFPPSTNATVIDAGEFISEAAAQQLNAQNDGVSEALKGAARQLFEAAADGKVTLRGIGKYKAGAEDATVDLEIRDIAPAYFTRQALAAFPSQEILGPGENSHNPRRFPRYSCVTVSAEMVRVKWPLVQNHLLDWVLANIPPKTKMEAIIYALSEEFGCGRTAAKDVYAQLPDDFKNGRGRPKKARK